MKSAERVPPSRAIAPDCPAGGCASPCGLESWCVAHGMSPKTSAEFASGVRANAYTRGNILFYQDNAPLGLFFLCSGRAKLVRAEHDGRRQIVRIVKGPGFVGERAVIARQPYAATAEVMDDSRICVIDAPRFIWFWNERPELARALALHLAAKLGEADGTVADIALRTIRERLAKFIALSVEAARQPGEAILLTGSRQELAELLGTSPEVVSRTLKEMSKAKLIVLEGQKVRVADAVRLRFAARLPSRPHDIYQARGAHSSLSAGRPSAHNGHLNGFARS